jgi:hypothetical protein
MLVSTMAGLLLSLTALAVSAEEPTAADYIEYMTPFVGSWTTKIEIGGKVVEGSWSARLSPTKACYVTHAEGGERPSFQSIDGYDPVTKTWTVFAFTSDGGTTIHRLRIEDVKKGQHYGKGVVAMGETVVNKADGTVVKITSKGTCVECSDTFRPCVEERGDACLRAGYMLDVDHQHASRPSPANSVLDGRERALGIP